ncbi:MAG: hypothetical protein OXS30_03265 [Chloroflexota bacterium]|nr:hypothetical protein [Chloroflexota bacterium]
MPSRDLFQRIVEGDEIALRDAFRGYGATARELARRIVGPVQADEIVEEAFLLIWSEPEHWASPALDVHILRIVRDLSLAVRRRGVTPEVAARDLQPFPITPDAALPDVVHDLEHDELQRATLRLPGAQGRRLEDAWFDDLRGEDEPLNAALETIVEDIRSGRLSKRAP